jgi:hypothetical protein
MRWEPIRSARHQRARARPIVSAAASVSLVIAMSGLHGELMRLLFPGSSR